MEWYWIAAIVFGALALLLWLSAAFYNQFFKRFYDLVLSGLAILLLSPLMLILTVVGAIAMRGNPFFVQQRPGKIDPKTGQEKIFRLIKYRTMSYLKDKHGNLLPDGKRLNAYGKFLRSTSLDELMELFNILIGDMSIIGPRPQLVRDMMFMTDEQRRRHSIRPGLSGLAQVNGRNNVSWEQKFAYDLQYIDEGISLFKDVKIIFQTVFIVFKRADTVRAGTESDLDFGDWLLEKGKITQAEYDENNAKAEQMLSDEQDS